MKMSKQQYTDYIAGLAPRSPLWRDLAGAFLIGGAICTLGQLVRNGYDALGLSEQLAGTATSITFVFLGALLTGLGVYDNLAKVAGAGTLVPITGFANSIAAPAMEFRSEGLITGLGAKMFIISGPVIVYGTLASVLYGVVLYFSCW